MATCMLFSEGNLGGGICVLVCSVLLFGGCVVVPCFYTFDPEGVSIHYVFFPVERYLWKNISDICATEERTVRHIFWNIFFLKIYDISGVVEGKERFYMHGHIRRTLRTKRYIKRYWNEEPSKDSLLEDIKSWRKKREIKKNRKNEAVQRHLADDIVPIERELRAKVRNLLSASVKRAKENGYELRTEYLYVTKDLDEFKARPNEGYTYTLTVEISRPNEKNEDFIACIDSELIFVRLGKKAYKGAVNEKALGQLEPSLSEALDEIIKVGIEEYCK